jgi:YHS domain-containing protein
VSGVVFPVSEASPHHEVGGKSVYFCCQGCANYFAGNRDDIVRRRRLGRSEPRAALGP